jgi:DNA-directed RNA polymerase specialized sigma24 family protein
MRGLMDGKPKDEATVARAFEGLEEIFEMIAAGLYSLASMLVGEGEQSVRLVEEAVANAEVSACSDPVHGRKSSRRALAIAALHLLAGRNPGCLAPPEGVMAAPRCCKEGGELVSAGISNEELESAIGGPERDRVRGWLASLPTAVRTVFVLRAVARFTSAETAALLLEHGGEQTAGWTAETVREAFRRGLCSLASQLIHASAVR